MNEQPPISDWLASLATPEARAALSGAAGGIVRWITLREALTVGPLSVLVGAICAVYLQPFVIPFLEPALKIAPSANVSGFAGFAVGLAGTTVARTLIDLFRSRRADLKKGARDDRGDEK